NGAALGYVTSIETDLSDPHRNGRRVSILGFADDRKIVYKPKDVQVDAAWTTLLGWLNDHEAPIRLRGAAVLVRDGYGWVEHILADTRPDACDAPLYYSRAGGLLALLYILRGVDFHYENVLISDNCPMLVDVETLLHPAILDFNTPTHLPEAQAL